jgi:hypothetical protein
MDELESIADDFFETRRYSPAPDLAVDGDGLPVVKDEPEDSSATDSVDPAV